MNGKNVNKFHLPQQQVYYKVWLSCNSVSTRWILEMFVNSRSDW